MNTATRPASKLLGSLSVLAALLLPACVLQAQDLDREPISYSTAPAANAISRLQERLDNGKATLTRDAKFGLLRALLKELSVPESSQVLVFSKTSLQRQHIAPATPRSLFFNDEVYVGFCQNSDLLEITAVDPQLGAVFYSCDQKAGEKPRFVRQTDACLLCHASSYNQGMPGQLVRSVYPDKEGYPVLTHGSHRIDQRSPLKERWGGWYVTGTSGKQTHLGNLIISSKQTPEDLDTRAGQNVKELDRWFRTSQCVTPHSDIVALMVLEHQGEMQNLLTRANLQTRLALHEEEALNKATGQPAGERWQSTTSRIQSAGDALVKYLLFSGEAALTDRIEGSSSFARDFAARGPRDKQGRSLRDLDLEKRLFKHPLSYGIYTAQFDGLPAPVKEYVLKRIYEVLTGKEQGRDFAHLSAAERRTILEIVRETKSDLPVYWKTP